MVLKLGPMARGAGGGCGGLAQDGSRGSVFCGILSNIKTFSYIFCNPKRIDHQPRIIEYVFG